MILSVNALPFGDRDVRCDCPDCGEPVVMEEPPPFTIQCGNCRCVYDVIHDAAAELEIDEYET